MKKQTGQTLVEIVAAIGVVVLLLTGLLAGAIASLRAAQYSKSKSLAVHYGQEAMETVRNMRNNSWNDFSTYADKTYCLDKAGAFKEPNTCLLIDNTYTRNVVFTWNDPIMKVDVTVSWQGGSIDLSTYFTQWK